MDHELIEQERPLFRDLTGDDPDPEITEIESLCLECREQGITRMLLTKIPFYKEVVVFSFVCSHCGWENNELQPASKMQEEGVQYDLRITNSEDLSRQIVKTEYASIKIPHIEFEIPPKSQEGVVTTIEGVIQRAITGIGQKLEILTNTDSEMSEKLTKFLVTLSELLLVTEPYTIILSDISGNSFIENICAPQKDPKMQLKHFARSEDEDKMLGIADPEKYNETEATPLNEENLSNEVLTFGTNCPACNAPSETNMKITKIPHFKEVVIMATNCTSCGHRTNEVKSGSGIEPLGTKISLEIREHEDLTRDLLKSETCGIEIPEIELQVGGGAIAGKFTTVEGLLEDIKRQLKDQNPIISGDSARVGMKEQMDLFLIKIDEIVDLKRKVTLILDDPCGNSYLQKLENGKDTRVQILKYERTFEQNEDLGLNDMKTENYNQS